MVISLTCSEALGGCCFLYVLLWPPSSLLWLLSQPHSSTHRSCSTYCFPAYCFLCECRGLGPSARNTLSSQLYLLKSWSSGLFPKPFMVFPQSQAGMLFLSFGTTLWEEHGGLTWIQISTREFPWVMISGGSVHVLTALKHPNSMRQHSRSASHRAWT